MLTGVSGVSDRGEALMATGRGTCIVDENIPEQLLAKRYVDAGAPNIAVASQQRQILLTLR
eukprot:3859552-Pyramimonas_sp.AAC.1